MVLRRIKIVNSHFLFAGTDWSWSPWSALSRCCCSVRCCWEVPLDSFPRSTDGNTVIRGDTCRRALILTSSTSSSYGCSTCSDWSEDPRRANRRWSLSICWTCIICTLKTMTRTSGARGALWESMWNGRPAERTQYEAFITKVRPDFGCKYAVPGLFEIKIWKF